jgi:hypothetical protein
MVSNKDQSYMTKEGNFTFSNHNNITDKSMNTTDIFTIPDEEVANRNQNLPTVPLVTPHGH